MVGLMAEKSVWIFITLFPVFVSITQFFDFWVMNYANWKHILGIFSFHNSVFNGILVIKHTRRDPLVRVSCNFWPFFFSLLFFSCSFFFSFFFFLFILVSSFFLFFFFFGLRPVLSFFFFFSSSFTGLCWIGFFFLFFFLLLSLGLGFFFH